MFTKTKKELKNLNEIESIYTYFTYAQIAINNFVWHNLPPSILGRNIERTLFEIGTCCFTYDDSLGFIALPATGTGKFNVYYEPTSYTVTGHQFTAKRDDTNSVFIKNNLFGQASKPYILLLTERIARVQRIIDYNAEYYKAPMLFKTSNKQLATTKTILNKMEQGEFPIVVDTSFDVDSFVPIPLTQEFVIDKLMAYKQQLKDELSEMLGFSIAQEKKERMLVDEVLKNNEFTDNGFVLNMLDSRLEAVEKINEMFGFNISIEINRKQAKPDFMYEEEEEGEGEDNE